jgi:hypothetical protein
MNVNDRAPADRIPDEFAHQLFDDNPGLENTSKPQNVCRSRHGRRQESHQWSYPVRPDGNP